MHTPPSKGDKPGDCRDRVVNTPEHGPCMTALTRGFSAPNTRQNADCVT
ncbi:hypothetical protein GLA29479_3860 [Lysobacter antibioticus]|nr:hypothetical protein GLA29479_3860 [Lysobacter antibioticus]